MMGVREGIPCRTGPKRVMGVGGFREVIRPGWL